MIRGQSADVLERDGKPMRQYLAVREELVSTPPRDVAHKLPNLVETVGRASREAGTERFLIGVSFSRDHLPLDYALDRIVDQGEDGYERESLKEPVSGEHRYLRFPYPPDPEFGACDLRGAMLGALESELRAADGDDLPAVDSEPNGTSETLGGRLYERFAAFL